MIPRDVEPEPARTARYPGLFAAIWLLVLAAILAGMVFVAISLAGSSSVQCARALAVANTVGFGIIILWGARKAQARFGDVFPLRAVALPGLVGTMLGAVGALAVGEAIYAVSISILPEPELFSSELVWRGDRLGAAFALLIVAPVTEEMLFRGLILRGFIRNYGPRAAIIGTAVLFAIAHISPWQYAPIFLVGVLNAWLVIRTGSLLPAILAHMMYNGIAFAIMLTTPDLGIETGPLTMQDATAIAVLFAVGLGVAAAGLGLVRAAFDGSVQPFSYVPLMPHLTQAEWGSPSDPADDADAPILLPGGKTMTAREIEVNLFSAIHAVPVIDAHEHLPPEQERTNSHVDFATLFSHYTQTDLESAGMTQQQYDALQSPETDLDAKWELFAPYWERIRHTGYARPALIAAKHFYQCDDISAQTYRALTERMQAGNTPGIYDRMLRQACGIKVCLTQIGRVPEGNRDLLAPLLPVYLWTSVPSREDFLARGVPHGVEIKTLDDYVGAMWTGLEAWKADGVVGMKMTSAQVPDPPKEDAQRVFDAFVGGAQADLGVLSAYLHQQMLDMAGRLQLPVAVHCGIIWDNWNDFYTTHPRNMIPLLMKHRSTNFDLYHAGIPWPREMGVMGKDFPNAYLNLCWCHIISPRMTASLLDEWIDLVPINKISGFGGDYAKPVEKVYGHLLMARQNIARVLAGRVAEGTMTEDQAMGVASRLLHDNPRELYQLDV